MLSGLRRIDIDILCVILLILERGEFKCEPDEYALLVNELKESGLIADHRSGLRCINNRFPGGSSSIGSSKTKA